MRGRLCTNWLLRPPFDPNIAAQTWSESASFELLTESIRRHAEIAPVVRQRFAGTLAQKNSLWREYRNYLRQALSNYNAALGVSNRSACLLYYYAMLNFAKAELLDVYAGRLVNQRIGHGLSFNPTRAKTVKGDSLTVQDGVFRLLYERRTGMALPIGTKLPVMRLMANIPEIGTQLVESGLGTCNAVGLYQMLAWDATRGWATLMIAPSRLPDSGSVTDSLLRKHFHKIDTPDSWRDHFGVSRRWFGGVAFYESNETVSKGDRLDPSGPMDITWKLKDIISLRTSELYDAVLAPYLYKTRRVSMPASLARYAVTYYASSLVRYKPQMFDSQLYPEQAYLFDSIARECAMSMLIDTLAGLEGRDQLFFSSGSLRT